MKANQYQSTRRNHSILHFNFPRSKEAKARINRDDDYGADSLFLNQSFEKSKIGKSIIRRDQTEDTREIDYTNMYVQSFNIIDINNSMDYSMDLETGYAFTLLHPSQLMLI